MNFVTEDKVSFKKPRGIKVTGENTMATMSITLMDGANLNGLPRDFTTSPFWRR